MRSLPLSGRPAAAVRAAAAGVVVMLAGAGPAAAQASDATLGRIKAQACITCHGALGLSQAPDAPNLAGQPAIYTAAQLRAYRSGARKHEVMGVIARPLSDEDITQLAAWFASIRVQAEEP
jgi:cytochrome c553